MNVRLRALPPSEDVYYPESDGKPMAENTLQYLWIETIHGNLTFWFRDHSDVLIAADNLIYPVQGDSSIAAAPDVYVAFGRPQGHRGCYKVFEEGGLFPQVVFEILSPTNELRDLLDKFQFYQQYGAQEIYWIDPEEGRQALEVWVRTGDRMRPVPVPSSWVSPLLGTTFVVTPGTVELFHPNGQRYITGPEARLQTEQANQRAEQEKQRAEKAEQGLEAARAKLRELGIDPDTL